MDRGAVLKNVRDLIRDKFAVEATGHDYWHMERVWMSTQRIARAESDVDMFVLELAVWLHDLADHKFHGGDMEAGPRAAEEWCLDQGVDQERAGRVADAIRGATFTASLDGGEQSIEGKILHDADKLDAIGAIGIARAFAYGGKKDRPIHHQGISHELVELSSEQYKKRGADTTAPTTAHFYEKLLQLKDRMLTTEAKKIAAQRHAFLEQFLDEFYAEWDGQR